MTSTQHASILAIAAILAAGCAEHMQLLTSDGAGWSTGYLFWPPPEATSVWTADAPGRTFGEVAARLDRTLRDAGYVDERVYPIGAGFAHGFAVTTRLERIEADATPAPPPDRWPSLYAEPSDLKWLASNREPHVPGPGRYRVLLVAFTDLPAVARTRPPPWNEQTVMYGPDVVARRLPVGRRVSPGYRVGVYVYEFEARSADGAAAFVAPDARRPADVHVRRSGLLGLGAAAP